MKEMSKIDLDKYKRSIITLEIKSLMPEKFINLLWKNKIFIKNVRKKDISTFVMDISLGDYRKIEEIGRKLIQK